LPHEFTRDRIRKPVQSEMASVQQLAKLKKF